MTHGSGCKAISDGAMESSALRLSPIQRKPMTAGELD
jgi:hypothetical protein